MKIKLFLLILTSFLVFSCATIKTSDKKLKSKILGTWSGFEEDNQIQGVTKYWIQKRDRNGTYILMYTAIQNCEVENFVEKGKWWIKDAVFYEKYENSKKISSYSIEVLNNNILKFKAKQLSTDFDNKEYEFIETRQE